MTEEAKTTNTNPMSFPQKQEEETTIDLMELFFAMLKHWWIILICIVAFGAVFGVYCQFLVKDSYQAEASLYITANTGDDSANVSYTNLQTSAALTNDYEAIIKNRYVLMQVIDNLGLSVDYDQLYNMVTVTNPEETHIIQISVTCEIPEDAITITNEVMNVSIDQIYRIVGGTEPAVVSEAILHTQIHSHRSAPGTGSQLRCDRCPRHPGQYDQDRGGHRQLSGAAGACVSSEKRK